MKNNKVQFWDSHYKNFNLEKPSKFGEFCLDNYIKASDNVIELGCGNGRDGVYIFKKTQNYTGIDLSTSAIDVCENKFQNLGFDSSKYMFLSQDMSNVIKLNEIKRNVFYSRFSLHSVNLETENKILDNLKNLTEDWIFLLEVRTIHDDLFGQGEALGENEFVTDHYRRFIDPETLINKIRKTFKIISKDLSSGLALYKNEDPIVLRLIFSKNE
jgi:SAM-dependent methyltransferase